MRACRMLVPAKNCVRRLLSLTSGSHNLKRRPLSGGIVALF